MGIQVIATEVGLYGVIRNIGDQFEIAEESAFSRQWMKRVDAPAVPEAPAGPVPAENHEAPAEVSADDEFLQKAKGKRK